MPWAPPPGSAACLGTASGSWRKVAGRSYATQCVQVPEGASGSSALRAKLSVLAGGSPHCNAGDLSEPSQVHFLGIAPPLENAELCNETGMVEPRELSEAFRFGVAFPA